MKILIVAATEEELHPSLSFLAERQIEYLITGVGMVACSYALSKRLQNGRVDLLIQVGIGGILDREAALGEVYQIVQDEIFEMGAEDRENFLTIEQLGLGVHQFYELIDAVPKSIPCAKKAQAITVNKVHGRESSIARLRIRYTKPLIESMEGASFFYVALQEGIPALQFRAVSNYVEPRNRAAWNIGLAVGNMNSFLQELIKSLV